MTRTLVSFAAALAFGGCIDSTKMTGTEALDALKEADRSARGVQLTMGLINVSTDLTTGDSPEDAAAGIGAFWEGELSCAEVSVEGNAVAIDYVYYIDPCVYQGYYYEGVTAITVESTDADALEVQHAWSGFKNPLVSIAGEATATWSSDEQSHRVVTEHTWTDLTTNDTVDVLGDHTLQRLDASEAVWDPGFAMDGTRDWGSATGEWSMEMSDLELRMADPAPQAGTVVITDPNGKTLEVLYERFDSSIIQATLTGLQSGIRIYRISFYGEYEEAAQ